MANSPRSTSLVDIPVPGVQRAPLFGGDVVRLKELFAEFEELANGCRWTCYHSSPLRRFIQSPLSFGPFGGYSMRTMDKQ
ncbi:hypothetical protein E1B28_003432 [Marasmius oreades]|uniref:Uncharacterized protein n=1 Tax=Marasmius oreades TaxID=181124 RepID=A0A9P7RMJ6_9AGAR|nr:uncharacterized protein E1B28_003432 [Marasmius oreades]KAG7085898.1 hypothetical protein E1B28_003432 [Marasmius oreades]